MDRLIIPFVCLHTAVSIISVAVLKRFVSAQLWNKVFCFLELKLNESDRVKIRRTRTEKV